MIHNCAADAIHPMKIEISVVPQLDDKGKAVYMYEMQVRYSLFKDGLPSAVGETRGPWEKTTDETATLLIEQIREEVEGAWEKNPKEAGKPSSGELLIRG